MGVNLLVIDDNLDQVTITKRVLKRAGEYTIDAAVDGEEGIEQIQSHDYDLVLCDYRLPGMHGLDVLRAIRKQGKVVPFIIVTSAGNERVAVEAIQEGAYDYLVKDAAYEELLPKIIQRSLERYGERKARQRLEEEQRQSRIELERAYTALHEAQQQLIQAAKLESVGRLAAGAAHEVKNPLAIMQMGVEYLTKHLPADDENLNLVVSNMAEAVRRADSVIRGLLDFSAHRLLEPKIAELNPIIQRSLLLVKHELDKAHIEVSTIFAERLPPILLDETKIEQVFINLFMNAVHAMSKGETLAVRTILYDAPEEQWIFRQQFSPGKQVVLTEVEDTGTGIPEKVLSKIFDPFFTTKPTGQGTGLGLSVTRTIVELHGGAIDIRNRAERGVCVTIALPIEAEELSEAAQGGGLK